jgi:hypothetical protein
LQQWSVTSWATGSADGVSLLRQFVESRSPVGTVNGVSVKRVIAYVDLESRAAKEATAQRFRESHWADKRQELERIVSSILDPAKYQMNVTLTAELDDGRQITGGGFSFSGPRDGVAAIWHRYRGPELHENLVEHERLLHQTYHVAMSDIQDAVDQMLGRDPEQHRPPRLAWDGLQDALATQGITVSEQDLTTAPLKLVLSDAATAEIRADQTTD